MSWVVFLFPENVCEHHTFRRHLPVQRLRIVFKSAQTGIFLTIKSINDNPNNAFSEEGAPWEELHAAPIVTCHHSLSDVANAQSAKVP